MSTKQHDVCAETVLPGRMTLLFCRECADTISPCEDVAQRGRCKECWDRWQQENRFRDLWCLIQRSSEFGCLEDGIAALEKVVKLHRCG
jgi:hypothetical protein